MTAQPAPYPPDTRAKGWRFELDMERARQSDTWTIAPLDARPWLLMLWATAWEQTPCGSLPNDDELIAARIGIPAKQFAKHRTILLRKWWLADDGRLYHAVLVQRVMEMMQTRNKDADRKRGFDSKVSRIKERDGAACVYCGDTKYLHIDHLIPRAQGGTHEDTNLVCACRRCNTSKGARDPEQAGMSFVNESASLMWEELRKLDSERVPPKWSRVGNALRQRDSHGTNDTGTGTRTKETKTPQPPEKSGGDDPAGFAEFWNAWPASARKQDRKKCAAKWRRGGFAQKLPLIVAHVEASKQSKQWRDGFEPAPLTYLNGERWGDGEMAEAETAEGFL